MTINELKSKVEQYRVSLKERAGKMCTSSENGPIGISIIDDVVAVIESQERRIKKLEKLEKGGSRVG